ncbi:hypothetical protein V6N13_035976 [Hibiscus sabdariffa]|uniref:Uncharacterized protein n=1 Tax=Hibiscus sabdariffa TaxID=183260 RepID=A0ABR2S860_9ROSI
MGKTTRSGVVGAQTNLLFIIPFQRLKSQPNPFCTRPIRYYPNNISDTLKPPPRNHLSRTMSMIDNKLQGSCGEAGRKLVA